MKINYQEVDSTITSLLDRQVPARCVSTRSRPSCLLFDEDCRESKRLVRALERSIRSVGGTAVADPATVSAWRTQRQRYTDLLSSKRSAFLTARVNADESRLRQLWRSFGELLGRRGLRPRKSLPPIFTNSSTTKWSAFAQRSLVLLRRPSHPPLPAVRSASSRRCQNLRSLS